MMEKIDEERNPVELFDWVGANGKSILKRKTAKYSQLVLIIGTRANFQFHEIPTHVFIFFPGSRSIC